MRASFEVMVAGRPPHVSWAANGAADNKLEAIASTDAPASALDLNIIKYPFVSHPAGNDSGVDPTNTNTPMVSR